MPPLRFDPEATVEEIAGIGRNARFDEALQDEEFEDIEVICRKIKSGVSEVDRFEEIPLAKPARAFYFGDRNLYEQEAKRFDQEEKGRILNTEQFRNNLGRFEELKRACQRGFVIPFVGAGMSKSVGCPEWKEYLLRFCTDAGLDVDAVQQRLEVNGDYEGVMNDIVTKLGDARFNLDFERDFNPPADLSGAVLRLPDLFDSCAITTNFDRILEKAYEKCGKAFAEKTTGRGSVNAFYRAIPAGERYLLKLHGNLDNVSERVLNKGEYDDAYGNDGNIHFERPIPKLLKRLYTSFSFLFVGCSLAYDRTIQTFAKIAQDVGADSLPHHYAILPCPTDPDRKTQLEQRLADAHISAIWYPEDEHTQVEEILELLSY
ncbi:MAG: SIR2 family protein [candidate division FCPU426 bacterium]